MLVLDTSRKLACVLSGAITTNQLEFVASYADASSSAFTEGINIGATSSTTPVDILAAPASGQRLVKTVWINNKDTVAATITVYIDQSGTTRRICKMTLAADETLEIGQNGIRIVSTASSGDYREALQTSATNFPASGAMGDGVSLTVPAGEWDLTAALDCAPVANVVQLILGISTTTGNSFTGLTLTVNEARDGPCTATYGKSLTVPNYRISITSSTVYYLKVYAEFTGTTPQYRCRLSARRVR